jgi:hypothetical protein
MQHQLKYSETLTMRVLCILDVMRYVMAAISINESKWGEFPLVEWMADIWVAHALPPTHLLSTNQRDALYPNCPLPDGYFFTSKFNLTFSMLKI